MAFCKSQVLSRNSFNLSESIDLHERVAIVYPGRKARSTARISKALIFILLSVLSLSLALPMHETATAEKRPAVGRVSSDLGSPNQSSSTIYPVPNKVSAGPVPNLSLPHTVLSGVDRITPASRVVKATPDNLTLYNGLILRLIGGSYPHEELTDLAARVPRTSSSWTVEVERPIGWAPLQSQSNSFTLITTNKTGTFVERTVHLSLDPYSGTMIIVYKATSWGQLKWDLLFTPKIAGHFRFVYAWSNVTGTIESSGGLRQFTGKYASLDFTIAWDDVSSVFQTMTTLAPGKFTLAIDLGLVQGGSVVSVDPSLISKSTSSQPTANSFQRSVFFEPKGGYYFAFYRNLNVSQNPFGYSYSNDGSNWSPFIHANVPWAGGISGDVRCSTARYLGNRLSR